MKPFNVESISSSNLLSSLLTGVMVSFDSLIVILTGFLDATLKGNALTDN